MSGLFADLGRHAPVGMAGFTVTLRFVSANEFLSLTTSSLRGWTTTIGNRLAVLFPEHAPILEPVVRQVFATGEPVRNVELSGPGGAPGASWWTESTWFPLFDGDTVAAVGCIVTETTAQRQAETRVATAPRRTRRGDQRGPNRTLRCAPFVERALEARRGRRGRRLRIGRQPAGST